MPGSEPNGSEPGGRLEIGPGEYADRRTALVHAFTAAGYAAYAVFGPVRVAYLTGFFFAATERPVGLVLSADGAVRVLIPELEGSHFGQQCPELTDVITYREYPGGGSGVHPLTTFAGLLPPGPLAADLDGYEHRWGYRGPRLSELMGRSVAERLELVDDLRTVKSAAETTLIREACRWGDHAHRLMQEAIRVGANELLVSHESSLRATREMLAELGGRYVPKAREGLPANAMFIRGHNTANPHGLHQAGGVQMGDTLVTGAYGLVGGYESELERTLFVGEPTKDQQRYFQAMLDAQDAGMAALRPGRTCAEVERDVQMVLREAGVMEFWRHHTGHAFGLEGHEHPFLDLDDHTVLRPGMIFSIEPGVYVPGLGGFRHSDTLLVTETGSERLSLYPRGLDAMIVA